MCGDRRLGQRLNEKTVTAGPHPNTNDNNMNSCAFTYIMLARNETVAAFYQSSAASFLLFTHLNSGPAPPNAAPSHHPPAIPCQLSIILESHACDWVPAANVR